MPSVANGWWVSGSPSEFTKPMSSPRSSTTMGSASDAAGSTAGALAAAPDGADGDLAAD